MYRKLHQLFKRNLFYSDDRQVVEEVEEAPAETLAEEGAPIAEGEEPPDEAGNENNNATEEGDAEGRASKGDGAAAEGDSGKQQRFFIHVF